jgi:MarR family transcriptional regulator, multiple antibiotic resistance protein MarR
MISRCFEPVNYMPGHVVAKLYAVASTSANKRLAGFFDDLVRCETRLYNALGERLKTRHGIVTSQFELLRYLRDHPQSRVAEVAATFVAGIGAISKGVDRLETRGWVARVPNPSDGRSSLINLTAGGAALVAAAEQTFTDVLDELVSPAISADQVEAAAATLGALRRALEHARVGLPIG